MIILTGILAALLVIATAGVLTQRVTHWLEKRGGFTILMVMKDDDDI